MNTTTDQADSLEYLDRLFTTAEAAMTFDVLPETIVNWIRTGRVRAAKLGSQWVIPVEEIDRLIDERTYR